MFIVQEVSLIAAFIAGLLSFLSPCILPLVPGYISYISGISLEDLKETKKEKRFYRVFLSALFFVMGFSLVFTLLGASATFFGQLLQEYSDWFKRVGGILIILFGLHMMGIIQIPLLNYQKRFNLVGKDSFHLFLTPFLIGFFFAFGWTPCIGPILATILVYASHQETVSKGTTLLMVYSIGLGIPFLLTALAVNKFYQLAGFIKKYFREIEIIGGIFMIFVGVFILTDNLSLLAL